MLLSQLGKGEVPSKTGVVVVDNRSYGALNLTLYRLNHVTSVAFFSSCRHTHPFEEK